MVCETSGRDLQRNPLHQDKTQIGHNTRYPTWRAGTRSGSGSPGRLQHGCKAETDKKHTQTCQQPFEQRRGRRPPTLQMEGLQGKSGSPTCSYPIPGRARRRRPRPPPPAPNTQGAPGAGAAMNSSAGAGRVPRHGNSIGTAGRVGVNNSGAPLAHTMPRKDEACSHRLGPLRALPGRVRTEGGARVAPAWTSPAVPGRAAGSASRATLAAPGLPSPPAGAERRHTTQHSLFPSRTQLPVSRREGKATGSVMCSPSARLPKLKAEEVEGCSLAGTALSLETFALD